MAISLSGQPQDLTAGYNPVYFYADSTNKDEPSFRYLVSVTNDSTSTRLANLKVLPRYGDGLLEVNISKILDSDLRCFSNDIDFNSVVAGFNNTISSGYQYSMDFGEEWAGNWVFGDVIFNSGLVRLTGTTDSGYVYGDQINVTGAAEPFVFTDNQFAAGSLVAFLVPTGHTVNVGDTITVFQTAGYTFEQYQGEHFVTGVTGTLITTTTPFYGSTPIEGGILYRNYPYDGLHLVLSAGTIGSNYYVDIDAPWINNSPTHSGFTQYYDGRLNQFTGLTTSVKHVFNGAIRHAEWTSWDSDNYSPTGSTRQFLTTLPDGWTVGLDNDVFLNIWGNQISGGTETAQINLYNSTGGTINSFTIGNLNTYTGQTEIQNLSIGPRGINQYNANVVTNGDFSSTDDWTLFGYVGGSTSISGGTLNYYDPVGDGEGLAWQYGILTIGCTYTVTLRANNNNFVAVQVGDTNDTYVIVPNGDNGTYSISFTAETEDFVIVMSSGFAGECGVNIDDVSVIQECPILNCDVASYDVQILSGGTSTASEVRTFNVDCSCSKFTNYPILFKDKFGSFVPYNFSLNNKQKVEINNRDTYKKFIGGLSNGAYTYSINEGSTSIYNIDFSESWTLNTDWLTEVEAAYFEELLTTNVASILINDVYHAIIVTDKRYERLRKINKKNIRYSIDIQFSNDNTSQSG